MKRFSIMAHAQQYSDEGKTMQIVDRSAASAFDYFERNISQPTERSAFSRLLCNRRRAFRSEPKTTLPQMRLGLHLEKRSVLA
jgi:hypothetical protein